MIDLCWLPAGIRDGMLLKRGRDNGQFLSRRFVLSEMEGTLKYFTKCDVSIFKWAFWQPRAGSNSQHTHTLLGKDLKDKVCCRQHPCDTLIQYFIAQSCLCNYVHLPRESKISTCTLCCIHACSDKLNQQSVLSVSVADSLSCVPPKPIRPWSTGSTLFVTVNQLRGRGNNVLGGK